MLFAARNSNLRPTSLTQLPPFAPNGSALRTEPRHELTPQRSCSYRLRTATQCRAGDLREKSHYVSLNAYDDDSMVRADAARDPASVTYSAARLLDFITRAVGLLRNVSIKRT